MKTRQYVAWFPPNIIKTCSCITRSAPPRTTDAPLHESQSEPLASIFGPFRHIWA